MSSTVELDENFFTCSICNDNYIDPRSLPCLHSFCQKCLSQHICYSAMDSPPSFLCPICRGLTLVPAGGKAMVEWADFFPGNFLLKDLMSQKNRPTSPQGRTGCVGLSCCLHHPEQQLSMFCITCQTVACDVCVNNKHGACLQLVALAQKDVGSDIRSCVERLDKEIADTQTATNQEENELAYLTRQRDKARNAIENHAASFILQLDRAKKNLFGKLDSEFYRLKRDIDKQLATDISRLEHLKGLKGTAHQLMQQPLDADVALQADGVIDKMNEILLSPGPEERPCIERMRATFSPDFSCLKRDFSLGTVTFYNSRTLAGSSEDTSDVPTSLTRSQSFIQLRRSSSADSGNTTLRSPDNSMRRPNDPPQRPTSVPGLQQRRVIQRPVSTSCLQQKEMFQTSISTPRLQENATLRRANTDNALQMSDTNLERLPRQLETLFPDENAVQDVEFETSEAENVFRDPIQGRSNSPPMFMCGEDMLKPHAACEQKGDVSSWTGNEMAAHDVRLKDNPHEDSKPLHLSCNAQAAVEQMEVVPTSVVTRFPLGFEDSEALPMITSIIITVDGSIMVADMKNKCIKTFKDDECVATTKLQYRPHGLAAASEDRVVASLPESKELVVVRTGKEPKIISTIPVQKSYCRLMHYRPGITAAFCPTLGCIDLVTLQGKTMKSFRILDHPSSDVSFCVDSKQEIIVWDSVKSSLMSVTKSGNKVYSKACLSLKDHDVAGIACDAADTTYIIYDNRIAMVSKNGNTIRAVENVFSCDCMCVSSAGELYVVEAGGECKILTLA